MYKRNSWPTNYSLNYNFTRNHITKEIRRQDKQFTWLRSVYCTPALKRATSRWTPPLQLWEQSDTSHIMTLAMKMPTYVHLFINCEYGRPAEACVHAPVMLHARLPHWLTESGRLATTCHPNLLHLLWWYLTQRCQCHYCWKKTEVKSCACPRLINNVTCARAVLHNVTPDCAKT